jgi:hypothetical protein
LWRPAAVLAIGLTAVLWPAARRPALLTPQLRTAVPALVSLLCTAASFLRHRDAPFGPGEIVGLCERVTALGGELHTGPRAAAGHGWEVRAQFPC